MDHLGHCGDSWSFVLGVIQGEPLSPFLYAMMINDMEVTMAAMGDNQGVTWDSLWILAILFADDCGIVANTAEGLQCSLNHLAEYCRGMCLKVNTTKTKVMVFRKTKNLFIPDFVFEGVALEMVNSFVYLGVEMLYNATWSAARSRCLTQARKASFILEKKLFRWTFTVRENVELFERLIVPVLLYGAELWGCGPVHDIERFVLKFLKRLLGLRASTPSYMVWLESGMTPIGAICKCRAVGFWSSFVDIRAKTRLASKVFLQLQKEHYINWSSEIGVVLTGLVSAAHGLLAATSVGLHSWNALKLNVR